MTSTDSTSAPPSASRLADEIASYAREQSLILACAESLTSGAIASTLGAAPGASDWFAGGVVAYRPESKFRALGVGVGPVVTETCARQMAWGVRRLLGADAAVAVTGVGGPGGSEGLPAGTVVIGVHARGIGTAQTHVFTGTPSEIVDQVVERALVALMARLRAH